jgi:hypothetical protein
MPKTKIRPIERPETPEEATRNNPDDRKHDEYTREHFGHDLAKVTRRKRNGKQASTKT